MPDVDANDRRRQQGEPAFLKHMLVQDFLPSLITILHSIPKPRNALLRTDSVLNDYGSNPQWWAGESIETPTVTFVDDSTGTESSSQSSCPPLVAEVQRLIAFLDKTERAYGSAEAISRIHSIKIYEHTAITMKPLLERFVETWDSIGTAPSLFQSSVTDASKSSGATKEIHMFEARTTFADDQKERSLVDLLDNCFWDKKESGDFDADHFLDDVAPVQILTVPRHSAWKLTVPSSLYLDRWLISNREFIEKLKDQTSAVANRVEKINASLKKLKSFSYSVTSPNGAIAGLVKDVDAIKLMSDSIKHMQERQAADEDGDGDNGGARSILKLQKISARVDEKIRELNGHKEDCQRILTDYSTLLTNPDVSPQPPGYEFQNRYVLRGVATASLHELTTYALYPASSKSSMRDASLQWWKMSFNTVTHAPKVEKARTTEDEVLRAAADGIHETMLIYVSEEMLSGPPPVPLPPQLERFVEKDNAAFRDEVTRSAPIGPSGKPVGPAVPISFASARTRSGSRGSDDSMTVQRDDDDEGIEMDDHPPPYEGDAELEDVKMETQPEMEERSTQGRPGLFAMPRGGQPSSDAEMEGP